jgi:hypothetical protein
MEQVIPGVTGLVAQRADANAIAAEIRSIIHDPALVCSWGVEETKKNRSIARFFDELTAVALAPTDQTRRDT